MYILGADVTSYKKMYVIYKNNFANKPLRVSVGSAAQVACANDNTTTHSLEYDISSLTGVLPISLKFNNTSDLLTTDVYNLYLTK